MKKQAIEIKQLELCNSFFRYKFFYQCFLLVNNAKKRYLI